jgi:multicomponent Na+:H+ antiporter subunit A
MGGEPEATVIAKPSALRSLGAIAGVLAVASLAFGALPDWLGGVVNGATGQEVKLVLWPGLTPALGVSAAIVALGAAWGWLDVRQPFEAVRWTRVSAAGVYRSALTGLNVAADRITGIVQNGSLPVYLAVIVTTVATVPLFVWFTQWDGTIALPLTNGIAEFALGASAAAGALAAARAERRLAAVLLLGLVGYAVAGIYVVFGAPDLALTQVLIETLTVALFALVLVKLPRKFGTGPRSLSQRTKILVSALVGGFAATAAVVITSVEPDRLIADQYIANAEAAGGTNVVNVILTNFRALDTLGEITVLAAATIGISALVAAGRGRATGEAGSEDNASTLVRP